MTNYAKLFIQMKKKLLLNLLEDFENLKPGLMIKCRFCKKKYGLNEC